jgi:hypothetical protein
MSLEDGQPATDGTDINRVMIMTKHGIFEVGQQVEFKKAGEFKEGTARLEGFAYGYYFLTYGKCERKSFEIRHPQKIDQKRNCSTCLDYSKHICDGCHMDQGFPNWRPKV